MEKIGIDVHKAATQVCILTEDGEFEEQRIRTERDALTALFGERARARIVLEAATESEWVARHLESLGHEVVVADPNVAPMYASRSRKVKTDRRDARALCEACHLGAYRPAHRSSEGSRMTRKSLAVHASTARASSSSGGTSPRPAIADSARCWSSADRGSASQKEGQTLTPRERNLAKGLLRRRRGACGGVMSQPPGARGPRGCTLETKERPWLRTPMSSWSAAATPA